MITQLEKTNCDKGKEKRRKNPYQDSLQGRNKRRLMVATGDTTVGAGKTRGQRQRPIQEEIFRVVVWFCFW